MRVSWWWGDLQQVRKHHTILERLRDPDQIQRILVYADLFREEGDVVGAEEAAAVRVDADAKVAHPHFEHGVADEVGDCGCDARVDLCGVVDGGVHLVVEGDDEDARDEGGGGGASC